MDKETQVLEMAKILCPKGTANCEKCSKNYKCDVKFSQLAELFDGGCQIVGDDEIVIKKSEYEAVKKSKNIIQLDISEELLKEYEYEMQELKQKVRQETTREILQEVVNAWNTGNLNQRELAYICTKNGIELE